MDFIKKHALFNSEQKLLVAVSGGVDSMVLCHLLARSNYNFSIAHCNFQLRGEASDLDEAFVKEQAALLDVSCYSHAFDTRSFAKTHGISTQMAARELRYNWFDELKRQHQFDLILTAHHKNDIAETILLNITRGTSINGITGILAAHHGIARPMLELTKSEILGFAINEKIKWREDASNNSVDYKRNKIRREVIPILEEINPSFNKQVARFAEKNQVVKKVFADHMEKLRSALLTQEGERLMIEIQKIKELDLSTFELEELLIPYGFNFDQCESILSALNGTPGAIFKSNTHQLTVDRDLLYVEANYAGEQIKLQLKEGVESFHLMYDYTVRLEAAPTLIDLDTSNAMFDQAKLAYPLTIRPWQQGDRFRPLGMKGEKLVSDYLIDQKVPLVDKKNVSVLLSGHEIAWVIGHRISEEFKVSSSTKEILHIIKN